MAVGQPNVAVIAQAATRRQDFGQTVAVSDICFPSQQASIYKVTRELKKESHSLFNCIHSILNDASFIQEVHQLYPGLPLIANLRCGLWYTGPNPDGACYYKSTDGHCGNWSFSTSRLNMHVATAAAKSGGCLIVDATRKGKRFPDAMSKTIPIWCAVLNRAVARVRASSPGVFQSTNRKTLETIRGTDAAGGSTRSSAPLQEINSSGGLVLSTASSTDPSVGLSRHMYRQPSLDSWLDDERSSHKRTAQQPCNGFHNAPLHSAGASCAQHLDANACNAAVEAGDSTVVVTLDMDCLLSVAEGEGEILSVSYGGSHAGLLHANSGLEILEDESVGFACEPALECVELDLLMRPSSNAWSVPTTPTCITAREHHSPGPNRQCASSSASTCVLSSSSESSTAGAGSPSQTGMASFISCGTAHSTIRMALDTDNGIELRPHSAEDLIAWDAECPPPIPITQPVFLSPPILEGSASDCGSCGSRRNIKDTAAAAPVHQTACEAAIPWDTGVHLPLWVGASEGRQIESRLEGWVDALMSVGEGLVKQLARELDKPLRPLWLCPTSLIWVDQVAQPNSLPFTPLFLISASSASGCQRSSGAAGSSFVYVPGAGDDEEAWAAGLTPELFWPNYQAFMSAGPETIHSVVQTLLAQARQDPAAAQASQSAAAAAAAAASASSASAASGQAGTGGPAAPCTGGMAGVAGVSPGAPLSSTAAKLVSYIPATDKHHLMPAGVVAARPGSVQVVGPGLYAIGSTGIYLGQLSAGAAPDVWQHVGALLSCGMQEHPSLAASNEPRWDPTQRTLAGKSPAVAVCNSAPSGVGMDDGRAMPGECPVGQSRCRGSVKTPSGRSMRCQPRYFHLPIAHSKVDRSSLMDHMADALDFLSYHLHCGRSVLIHDVTGLDTCVCVAVAMLLACFSPGESDKGSSPRLLQPFMVHKAGYVATPVPVSKEEVRRRLAFVSSSYPQARPSRGMLKQVYNFLCA